MPNVTQKKIAVVVPKYGLVGGGERFVSELTERLAQNPRYDIHVFANRWQKKSDLITFHKVPQFTFPKWLTTISFAYFANKKIDRIGFDLIHTHDRIFQADLCSMHFIPHEIWSKKIRRKKRLSIFDRATSWIEKRMFAKGCRYIMPVSSLAQESLLQQYSIDPRKMHIIHPGIEIETEVLQGQTATPQIRTEFNIAPQDFLLLFVAMNFELKGLDNLLAALSLIQKRHKESVPPFKLLIVGKGNQNKYQAVASSLGLKNKVIFAQVRQDMLQIYREADMLVLLSNYDTFGMVVSEAMIASLPVIISNRVGARDLVREGENGFVVERENIEQIGEKIFLLMTDKQKQLEMGKNARATAVQHSWESVVQEVSDLYEKFLSDKTK